MTTHDDSLDEVIATYDVVVIGGGPAGTTISSLLSEKGWSVCLLEKAHHPRFHIGESLLPMNMPILERLGVLDKVAGIGIKKYAAEFNSPVTAPEQDIFYFAKAADKSFPFAYEVRRSEFDELLFRNCKDKGVKAFEGITVNRVDLDQAVKKVWASDETGASTAFHCQYVVDASGRDTFLSKKLNTKKKNPDHQMAAIFGHFHQVERRTGSDEGNISIYWFEHGWMWLIPLKDGMMSAGCVCWPEYLKTRDKPLNEFLQHTLFLLPEVADRFKNASLAGDAQATGNYSYSASRMAGDGYLLIGDAYAFVDPVFSSGVYLAMQGAVKGADYVDTVLKDSSQQVQLASTLQLSMQKEISAFCWFIYRFNSPALHKLLMSSDEKRLHPVKQKMKSAVISVLAGDAGNQQIKFYLNLFKGLYYFSILFDFKRHWRFMLFRRGQNRVQVDV
ncbi:MAG: FAD-dependent oxidoreductase [Methylococcaceae bacterium]|nr:FAD-dependent oxidoreductase [Methylococcaceae bacterium]